MNFSRVSFKASSNQRSEKNCLHYEWLIEKVLSISKFFDTGDIIDWNPFDPRDTTEFVFNPLLPFNVVCRVKFPRADAIIITLVFKMFVD